MRSWRMMAFVVGLCLAAAPAWAQSTEFVANLTSGPQAFPLGEIVQPFFGDTGTSGWAVVTIDPSARTLSYRVTVVNPSGASIGQLFVSTAGTAVSVLTFAPPVHTSIVLNNFLDDFCYDLYAITFEGTVAAAELTLGREQGARSADEIFAAVGEGKAYLQVGSTASLGTGIRGSLAKKVGS
jgi:hypothetical protein